MSMTIEEALEKLFVVQDKVNALSKEADVYKDFIKKEMVKQNAKKLTSPTDPSRLCTLSTSVRRTCKDKAGFISSLVSIGAKHCIATEITPNMEVLESEIGINPEVKTLYDNYVKEVEVLTFKVK